MKELNFTKEHTKIVKGIAILMMLSHHLFAFPNRININQKYISLLVINNFNIEYIIGCFGKICVSMYLFLSGYGTYMMILQKGKITIKESLKKVKSIYINYWIVFVIFIPIGFIFFNKNFSISEFIANFLGLSSSYNQEWWFFRTYIELILLFPILKIIVNDRLFNSILKIIGLAILSRILNKILNILPNTEYLTNNLIYKDIISLLQWQAAFFIGYIFAKFDIYAKMTKNFIKLKIDNKKIYILLCILVVIIRYIRNGIIIDAMLTPVFIFATTNLVYNSILHKLFIKLGNHSTNMWLSHSFFCYAYFQSLVFKPRISVLILIWLVILSVLSSKLINCLIRGYNILLLNISNKLHKESNI